MPRGHYDYENQTSEVIEHIGLKWAAFGWPSYILKNAIIPFFLKAKVCETCLLLAATYGFMTVTLTKQYRKVANYALGDGMTYLGCFSVSPLEK